MALLSRHCCFQRRAAGATSLEKGGRGRAREVCISGSHLHATRQPPSPTLHLMLGGWGAENWLAGLADRAGFLPRGKTDDWRAGAAPG